MKRHPIGTMVGGAILAAWIPFWTFVSGLSTIDFMRTSSGHPSIGTFYLSASFSAGLTVVGIGVMVYAFILLWRRASAGPGGGVAVAVPSETTRMADYAQPPHASSPNPPDRLISPLTSTPRALSDAALSTVILPDGRAISSCNLEDIIAIHKSNTTDQAKRLLVGKWIKFSGKVEDNLGKGVVTLTATDRIEPPAIVLHFADGWEEQLSSLQRGSSVTARGQIDRLGDLFISLKGCELL